MRFVKYFSRRQVFFAYFFFFVVECYICLSLSHIHTIAMMSQQGFKKRKKNKFATKIDKKLKWRHKKRRRLLVKKYRTWT